MPDNLSMDERHRVPAEFKQLPYSELSQFIMTRLEECPYPTVKELSEWFGEHAEYYRGKNIKFGYGTFVPNKVKKLT